MRCFGAVVVADDCLSVLQDRQNSFAFLCETTVDYIAISRDKLLYHARQRIPRQRSKIDELQLLTGHYFEHR